MNETIQALIELQRIDDEIRVFTLQRDELAANLERLNTILERMGTELTDKREKLAEATRFYQDKKVDLQADGERMNRAKQKLASVTRTKEYAAMQRELDTLRKKFSEDEAELKRLAEAIEEYQSSIAQQEGKLAELQAEVDREENASAERLEDLEGQIGNIAERQDDAKARLPRNIFRRYKRVLERRDGKAVVPVVEGQCTGCQMRLPPQVYILVQRGETVETCQVCNRYLFCETDHDAADANAEAGAGA